METQFYVRTLQTNFKNVNSNKILDSYQLTLNDVITEKNKCGVTVFLSTQLQKKQTVTYVLFSFNTLYVSKFFNLSKRKYTPSKPKMFKIDSRKYLDNNLSVWSIQTDQCALYLSLLSSTLWYKWCWLICFRRGKQ